MNNEDHQNRFSMLQSDCSEEDELETDLVTIKLDSDQIIQIRYSQLCKYSKLIREKYLISDARTLLSADIQKFQQENKIDTNNIISFFRLFRDEDIEMTTDKYFDFFKLSEYFQIKKLTKKLEKYFKQTFSNIDAIIQFLLKDENSQFKFTAQIESILIDHVDEFIKNENTKKLTVTTIEKILEKCKKKRIPNSELFDLIMTSIPNFYILFSFIDIEKLNDEQFNELLKNYSKSENEKYFQKIPCNLLFLSDLKNKVSRLNEENLQFKQKFVKIQSELAETTKKNENLNFENNQLKKQIFDCKNQVEFFRKENEKLQKQVKKIELMKNDDDDADLFDPFASSSFKIRNLNLKKSKSSNVHLSYQNNLFNVPKEEKVDLFDNSQEPIEITKQSENRYDSEPLQDPFPSENNNNDNYDLKLLNDPFLETNQRKNNYDSEILQDPFIAENETKNSYDSEPLQDPFPSENNTNYDLKHLNDPFLTTNQGNNNYDSEPLQDPFPSENNNNNNYDLKPLNDPFLTTNENINSNYSEPLQDPFPSENDNNSNVDPFGTQNEEKDDLFVNLPTHFPVTTNNIGNHFSNPNTLTKSIENSNTFGERNNNTDPFLTINHAKDSDYSEPLQDPFPMDNEDENNSDDLFQEKSPQDSFTFNGGKQVDHAFETPKKEKESENNNDFDIFSKF